MNLGEVINQSPVEEIESEETTVEETTHGEQTTVEDDPVVEDMTPAEQATYEANHKYKVYDKELEFPEHIRPLITSKEREDEFREIFGKAGAFGHVKEKADTYRKERDDYYGKFNERQNFIKELNHAKQHDKDRFFQMTGMTEDEVYGYVNDRLKIKELPEEQQLAFKRQSELQRQLYERENALQSAHQSQAEMVARLHNIELDHATSRPDVSEFAQLYDSVKGEGAFKAEVGAYGEYMGHMNKYVTPTQAVEHVLQKESWIKNISGFQTRRSEQPVHRPTIPNMGPGRSVSPAGKKITSIEGIRQHAKKLYG